MIITDKGIHEGFCPTCAKTVRVKWEDCGIGAYEYWGAGGIHHDWQPFCSEYGEDLDASELDYYEVEPDLDDYREDR